MNTVFQADVRELRKWLNEEPNRPLDKTALARVLHAIEFVSEAGVIVTESDGEVVLGDEVAWRCGMPPAGTALYTMPHFHDGLGPDDLRDDEVMRDHPCA